MTSGLAMQMQLELSALMRRHGFAPRPSAVALSAPLDHIVDVVGYAATTDIDFTRQRFRAYAFNNLCLTLKGYPLPPLHYKHDESRIVGEIISLKYDDRGQLRISARVDDPTARRANAFSIGARILAYEIRDADSAENVHALISAAELVEISLSDCPANPFAIIQHRSRVAPMPEYLKALHAGDDLIVAGIENLQRQLRAIAEKNSRLPILPGRPEVKRATPRTNRPAAVQSTQFQQLVAQLGSQPH